MPLTFNCSPDAKYMIFVKESADAGRRIIILIEGPCKMEECVIFVMRYPTDFITAATEHTIPISSDCFEREVTVQVRCFTTATEGQEMPEWLEYFTNEYGGRMRFIDSYTFNIMRHVLVQQIR